MMRILLPQDGQGRSGAFGSSRQDWLKLAGKIKDALVGQGSLLDAGDAEATNIVRRLKTRRVRHDAERSEPAPSSSSPSSRRGGSSALIKVDPSRVATERILRDSGLSATVQRLACVLNH